MKKIFTLLCMLGALAGHAQQATTTNVSGEKKMSVGLGASGYLGNGGYGAVLRGDYIISNKFSLGLRMHTTTYGFADYEVPTDATTNGYKVDYTPGMHFSAALNATYYLFGNNSDAKGGVYGALGFGYQTENMKQYVESTLDKTNPLFYTYDQSFGDRGTLTSLTFGADRKIGPGRLFVEVANNLMLTNTRWDKYSNITSALNGSLIDWSYDSFFNGNTQTFLNLGYQLSF